MRTSEQYKKEIHLTGRIGLLITIVILLAVPIIICSVYDIFPTFKQFMLSASGLLAIFVPLTISEVISFTPLLGSAAYLTFITGNIMNLKFPCAKGAMDVAGVTPGTEKADVIATLSVGVSSMLTILVIAAGVLLLVPLRPILELPAIKTATDYMLPSLFGALALSLLRSTGEVQVKNVWMAGIVPFVLILVVNLFVYSLVGLEGVALLLMIPLTILFAKILHKRGIIKVSYLEDKGEIK
jgi:hypothetical protein